MQMSTVNPTAVLGPALGPDYSHSIRLIKSLADGPPGCQKINSGFVDVRDVAAAERLVVLGLFKKTQRPQLSRMKSSFLL